MDIRVLIEDGNLNDCDFMAYNADQSSIAVKYPDGEEEIVSVDGVYHDNFQGSDVFTNSCLPLVERVSEGFNGCYIQHGDPQSSLLLGEGGLIEMSLTSLLSRLEGSDMGFACSCVEFDGSQVRDLGKACISTVTATCSDDTTKRCGEIPGAEGNPFFAPFGQESISMDKIIEEECDLVAATGGASAYLRGIALFPFESATALEDMLAALMAMRVTGGNESPRTDLVFTIYVANDVSHECVTLRFVELAQSRRIGRGDTDPQLLKDIMTTGETQESLLKALNAPGDISIQSESAKLTMLLAGSFDVISLVTTATILAESSEASVDRVKFAAACHKAAPSWDKRVISKYASRMSKLSDSNKELKGVLKTQMAKPTKEVGTPPQAGGVSSHRSSGGAPSARKLVSMLEAFDLSASVDGDRISANGKQVQVSVLAKLVSGSDSGAAAETTGISSGGGTDGAAIKKNEPSTKKLKKIIGDLEDELRDIKAKAKDRKDEITEKAKLITTLTQQLTRAQTSLRHKEFQYDTLTQEKSRAIDELDASLRRQHKEHLNTVVADNQAILQQQHKLLQSVPENLRTFTVTRQTLQQKFKESDIKMRAERDQAMKKLSSGQKQEIKHLKLQYEHWLSVKNDQIRTLTTQFNTYREEKAKALEACEKEIVRLYDHGQKLEGILGGVEQGEYQVTQTQSSIGRPTTGVIMALDEHYDVTSRSGPRRRATREEMADSFKPTSTVRALMSPSRAQTGAKAAPRLNTAPRAQTAPNHKNMDVSRSFDGGIPSTMNVGGITLPKGLRPNNPFVAKSDELTLAKKIVSKYKQLEEQANAVNQINLNQTLTQASSTDKAIGVLDPQVQSQISNMLTKSTMSREGQAFVYMSPKKRTKEVSAMSQAHTGDEDDMGITLEDYMPASVESSTEPEDGLSGTSQPSSQQQSFRGKTRSSDLEEEQQKEIRQLKKEITRLEAEATAEKIRAERVVRNLQSDDVLIYIQKLEEAQAKLHAQVRDVSSQLHTSRVTNNSLSRRIDKLMRSGGGSRLDASASFVA